MRIEDRPALLGEMMRDARFWEALVPPSASEKDLTGPLNPRVERARSGLETQGYFELEGVFSRAFVTQIENQITAITHLGLPALFVFAFDAPWQAFEALEGLLGGLLGEDYRSLAAFWAWRIDQDEAGWPQHRDRTVSALDPNGAPRSLTLWIPITDATLDNGCIHVVPAPADAHYRGDLMRRDFRPEDVKPLPIAAGGLLGWSQNLIHWGGRSSRTAARPRMSLSAEFQRNAGDPFDPLMTTTRPPLGERLALIGEQLLKYRHMQEPSTSLRELAESFVRRGRDAQPGAGLGGVLPKMLATLP